LGSIPWPSQTKGRVKTNKPKLIFIASLLDVSIKEGLCEDRPASSLVVSLGKALNGIASTYEWIDGIETVGSLTLKPKRSPLRCFLVEVL